MLNSKCGKVFRIGTVLYNWPMSAHASQAFSIARCTDSEDLPKCVCITVSAHPSCTGKSVHSKEVTYSGPIMCDILETVQDKMEGAFHWYHNYQPKRSIPGCGAKSIETPYFCGLSSFHLAL